MSAEIVSLAEHQHHRREAYRIVISPGLWRNSVEVSIEPPTSTHPLRTFRTYSEAMACALAIQGVELWPIFSNCGDEPGPEAA